MLEDHTLKISCLMHTKSQTQGCKVNIKKIQILNTTEQFSWTTIKLLIKQLNCR